MTWHAVSWAIKQTCRGPEEKLLLMLLADAAGDCGESFRSQKTLADGSHMSVDSIQRYLKKLEDAGLIYRVRRRRDSGGWTSSEVVVLFCAEARDYAYGLGMDRVAPPSNEAAPAPDHAADCGMGQGENGAENAADHAADCGIPIPQGCGIPYRTGAVSYNQTLNQNNPPNPPVAGGALLAHGLEKGEGQQLHWRDQWADLVKAYPPNEGEGEGYGLNAFRALEPAERTLAVSRAAGWNASRSIKSGKKRSLRTYVRDRVWAQEPPVAAGAMVPVFAGTPAWEAWVQHWRATGAVRRLTRMVRIGGVDQSETYWAEPMTIEITGSDGRKRRGRMVASLFPPKWAGDGSGGADPPAGERAA